MPVTNYFNVSSVRLYRQSQLITEYSVHVVFFIKLNRFHLVSIIAPDFSKRPNLLIIANSLSVNFISYAMLARWR